MAAPRRLRDRLKLEAAEEGWPSWETYDRIGPCSTGRGRSDEPRANRRSPDNSGLSARALPALSLVSTPLSPVWLAARRSGVRIPLGPPSRQSIRSSATTRILGFPNRAEHDQNVGWSSAAEPRLSMPHPARYGILCVRRDIGFVSSREQEERSEQDRHLHDRVRPRRRGRRRSGVLVGFSGRFDVRADRAAKRLWIHHLPKTHPLPLQAVPTIQTRPRPRPWLSLLG